MSQGQEHAFMCEAMGVGACVACGVNCPSAEQLQVRTAK